MFALTVLYCMLFIYLRVQSSKFGSRNSYVENKALSHELQSWQANLEVGKGVPPTASQTILTTQTVTVITEDRSTSVSRINRPEGDHSRRRMTQVAVRLLCYPVVYICLTMPVSIARLAQFSGHNWGLTAIHVGAAIYVCSGLVNVILYTATRKGIISWNWLAPKRKMNTDARRISWGPRQYQGPYRQASTSRTVASKHSPLVPTDQSVNRENLSKHDSDSDSNFEELNYAR
jgi:hypothetical protein